LQASKTTTAKISVDSEKEAAKMQKEIRERDKRIKGLEEENQFISQKLNRI
jgi:uncharacterized protein (DUF3084 family)